jgi:hypothetical protein
MTAEAMNNDAESRDRSADRLHRPVPRALPRAIPCHFRNEQETATP